MTSLQNASIDASGAFIARSTAAGKDGIQPVGLAAGSLGPIRTAGLWLRTAKLEQNREQVGRMVSALLETMDHIGKNRPKVVEYLNTKWKMNRDLC